MVEIIRGTTQKPVSEWGLVAYAKDNLQNYAGFLYIGFPVMGTPEGHYGIDALLVLEEQGLVLIDLVEGPDVEGFAERQDFGANMLETRLRQNRDLMNRRKLRVPVHTVTFAPAVANPSLQSHADYPICNEGNMLAWLAELETWKEPECYTTLLSVLQSVSTIRKRSKPRQVKRENSRGDKLRKLEEAISNLDNLQGRAVIETVEGVQRIRGLAGSGKTIVLALKAAYLHAQHPEWKIVVTFNTRSLKAQFKRWVERFTLETMGMEPDWTQIQVMHAWGAPGEGEKSGLYHLFCQCIGTEYYDYRGARQAFGLREEFGGACKAAMEAFAALEPEFKQQIGRFDAILVDEAQDLTPVFLRICYELLNNKKRLVYAYDELQNLGSASMPPPEEIFGKGTDGPPRVRFDTVQAGETQPDIILKRCYRNSRPVLVAAHALGFGIYRNVDTRTGTGLVQIFEQNQLWEEIGYEVVEGTLEEGSDLVLARSDENSPRFLEEHSEVDDLIQFISFDTAEAQAQWLANAIAKNLDSDELSADDIVVINPDPLTTRREVAPVRALLFDRNIQSHTAGVETSPDVFFKHDVESVAFSGIYRAKGNEAGMVYIINAQDCYRSDENLAGVRNQLFTGITRSKAWVRVLGIGAGMRGLEEEFNRIRAKNFRLAFCYPNARQKKMLNVVNRDMSAGARKEIQKNRNSIKKVLDDLESGRMRPEDLDREEIDRLHELLALKTTDV